MYVTFNCDVSVDSRPGDRRRDWSNGRTCSRLQAEIPGRTSVTAAAYRARATIASTVVQSYSRRRAGRRYRIGSAWSRVDDRLRQLDQRTRYVPTGIGPGRDVATGATAGTRTWRIQIAADRCGIAVFG